MKKLKVKYYEGNDNAIWFLFSKKTKLKRKKEKLLFEWDKLQKRDLLDPKLRINEEETDKIEAQLDLIEEVLKFYEKK